MGKTVCIATLLGLLLAVAAPAAMAAGDDAQGRASAGNIVADNGAPLPVARTETLDFQVLRDGDPIGYHKVTITREGRDTHVAIDIHFRVTLAGMLTLYRYIHKSEEVWRGDRLVSLHSTTDNNGKQQYLNATAVADGLQVDGSGFRGLLPAGTMPTSYWRSDFVTRHPIMDSQDGHVLDVVILPTSYEMASLASDSVPARRYRVSGEFDWTLWYDAQGNWVKSAFKAMDGSSIEYRLQ